jgi:hypothetical protein
MSLLHSHARWFQSDELLVTVKRIVLTLGLGFLKSYGIINSSYRITIDCRSSIDSVLHCKKRLAVFPVPSRDVGTTSLRLCPYHSLTTSLRLGIFLSLTTSLRLGIYLSLTNSLRLGLYLSLKTSLRLGKKNTREQV